MPTCCQCDSSFPNRVIIEGVVKNLHSRKFCLECSPFGLHNNKTLRSRLMPKEGQDCVCSKCNKRWFYKRGGGGTKSYCPPCYLRVRFNTMKKKAVAYKGGRCVLCGYDKYIGAMQFHHTDPDKKEFSIGNSYCLSWSSIMKELDKCILACSRCHTEIHGGLHPEYI